MKSRLLVRVMIVITAAGCSGDQIETLLVTSDCVFNGPERIEAGPVRLTLSLEGLGETGAVIAQLEDGHSYDELTAHFDESGAHWDDRPDWLSVRATLTVSGNTSDSATTSATLEPGSHAVICIRYWDEGSASPVARLEVEPAD